MPGGPGSLTTTVVAADGSAAHRQREVVAIDIAGAAPVTQTGVAGQPLTFAGLATPAIYRITATDPSQNFLDAEITQQLDAGQAVTTNPIGLAAVGRHDQRDGRRRHRPTRSVTSRSSRRSTARPRPRSPRPAARSGRSRSPAWRRRPPTSSSSVAPMWPAPSWPCRLDAGSSSTGMTVTMTSATGTITRPRHRRRGRTRWGDGHRHRRRLLQHGDDLHGQPAWLVHRHRRARTGHLRRHGVGARTGVRRRARSPSLPARPAPRPTPTCCPPSARSSAR